MKLKKKIHEKKEKKDLNQPGLTYQTHDLGYDL
jgi:hypothetical protein